MIDLIESIKFELNENVKPKVVFFDFGNLKSGCRITIQFPLLSKAFGGPIKSHFWKAQGNRVVGEQLKKYDNDYEFTAVHIQHTVPMEEYPKVDYFIMYKPKSEQQKDRERIEYFISTLSEL